MKMIRIPTGWRSIKVSESFDFLPTTSHSKGEMTYDEEDSSSIYNIHYGDIHAKYKTYVDFEKNKIPHLKDKENGFDRNLLRSGDLVMVDASEDLEGVGTCIEIKNLNNKKCVAGLHTFALRDSKKHTVPKYRGLMLKHKAVKHRMQQVSTYSKVFGISKKSFLDIDLILPPLPEQEKIVEILETWDESIEKLIKQIIIKRKIKLGLMQRLLKEKLQLKGYNSSWEEKRIKEFGEIVTGNTPSMAKKENYGEKYLWATAQDFNGVYIKNTTIKLSEVGKKVARLVPKGTVLVTCIASIGKNGIAFTEMAFNQQINGIIPNTSFNSEFVYYLIQNSKNALKRASGAGAVPIISKSIFENIKLRVPPLEEQIIIANILTTADREIEYLEKKRELIEAQKKFLLNNLVTGKIRLPEFINAN